MAFHLDEFLPYRLTIAAQQVSRRLARLYAGEGLSVPEWRVLAHLNHSGVVSVRDIHDRVSLDKSVVSRAATRLDRAGLLRKSVDAGDRRLVALELTPEGRALMARLSVLAEGFQAQLMAELGPEAAATLAALERLSRDPDDAGDMGRK